MLTFSSVNVLSTHPFCLEKYLDFRGEGRPRFATTYSSDDRQCSRCQDMPSNSEPIYFTNWTVSVVDLSNIETNSGEVLYHVLFFTRLLFNCRNAGFPTSPTRGFWKHSLRGQATNLSHVLRRPCPSAFISIRELDVKMSHVYFTVASSRSKTRSARHVRIHPRICCGIDFFSVPCELPYNQREINTSARSIHGRNPLYPSQYWSRPASTSRTSIWRESHIET